MKFLVQRLSNRLRCTYSEKSFIKIFSMVSCFRKLIGMSYLFCYRLSPHHLSYFSIVVRRLCNKELWKWAMVLILILFKYFWKFSTAVKCEIISVDSRTIGLPHGNLIKRADCSQKRHSCMLFKKHILKWFVSNFLFQYNFAIFSRGLLMNFAIFCRDWSTNFAVSSSDKLTKFPIFHS